MAKSLGSGFLTLFPVPFSEHVKLALLLFSVVLLSFILSFNPSTTATSVLDAVQTHQLFLRSHMLNDWLLLQAYSAGKNGYDLEILEGIARMVGLREYSPAARYSPPWYYIFVAPLGYLSAESFVMMTFLLSVLASLQVVRQAFRLLEMKDPSVFMMALAVLFFPPILINILGGQVSAFLALAMLFAFRAFQRGSYQLAGFWLALLSVKPQSTYLVVFTLILMGLLRSPYKILIGYFTTLTALVASSYLANPAMYQDWCGISTPKEFQTLTLATFLRHAWLGISGNDSPWLIYCLPALSIAIVTSVLFMRRTLGDSLSITALPIISGVTAPYGWLYDFVIIAPANCFLWSLAMNRIRSAPWIFALMMGVNLFWTLGLFTELPYLSYMVYPILLLAGVLSASAWKKSDFSEDFWKPV